MDQEPPRKKLPKRALLASWLAQFSPALVGEREFEELRQSLAPVSGSYLRKLLRESGAALAPMVEGVRQRTFDELESTLIALLDEYEHADAVRRNAVRRIVIAAKDHARWSARDPEKRADKEEMTLWMMTWLENPAVFREWIKLRRRTLDMV